jgi:hypothetical protein
MQVFKRSVLILLLVVVPLLLGRDFGVVAKEQTRRLSFEKRSSGAKYGVSLLDHLHGQTREEVKSGATRKRTPHNADRLIFLGNVGNFLTMLLSLLLLIMTPFGVQLSPGKCGPGFCDPGDSYDGPLDGCYVCDGFCISNPTSEIVNSHMLSLYADIVLFFPLFILRRKRKQELEELGLEEFFLSSLKINSILGHGIAHSALSLLTKNERRQQIITAVQYESTLALVYARFSSSDAHSFLRASVAPFLAGTSLALTAGAQEVKARSASPIDYLVFIMTCFVFFEAGIPPASNNWVFSLTMAIVATYMAVGILGVHSISQSFVIVFTSSYLVSTFYQLFFWNKATKRANSRPYAITAWCSNFTTTLVGWALALFCTKLKSASGHMLYDLSISLSYVTIYYLTKKMSD